MLIFRDKRVRDNVDPIPNKMPNLSRGVYFAVQRTLKSIWYGGPTPIQEAVTYVQMEKDLSADEQDIKEALADYANLIIRKILPTEHDQIVNKLVAWEQEALRTAITRGLADLEKSRQEERVLLREVSKQEQAVQALRRRKFELNKQEKSLTKRLTELQENEQHVQKELERINGLHPVEIDRCLEIVNVLAKEANDARD